MASWAMWAPCSWTVKPHCTPSMALHALRWITALAELGPIAPIRSSILLGRKAVSLMIFLFASVPWPSRRRPRPRVHPFGNGRILQHDEAQLCGLRHRFGPTVCIKLGEYRSDMKLDGVE
jgi:hypothetical protein